MLFATLCVIITKNVKVYPFYGESGIVKMKLRKVLAFLMIFVIAAASFSLTGVAAGADVDFTLRPVTENIEEFAPGDTVELEVVITTKTSNGYNSFILEIDYNQDVLVYSDEAFEEDGCSGSASNGLLTLTYEHPEGTNSTLNSVNIIRVKFTVLEGAPGGEAYFNGNVKACTGKNTAGASTPRQTAPMYQKAINIADIPFVEPEASDSDYSDIITGVTGDEEDQVSSTVTVVKKSGMPVFWAIVLIILALGGGLVIGYKICENRIGSNDLRKRYDDIEDDDDDELPTFKKKQPMRKPMLADDDDDGDFDTSYFGRASEVSIGADYFDRYDTESSGFEDNDETEIPSVFSEVDEDEAGFPGSFFPKNYSGRKGVQDDDGFGSFDFESDNEPPAKADAAFNFSFSDDDFSDDDFGSDDFDDDDMDSILRRR